MSTVTIRTHTSLVITFLITPQECQRQNEMAARWNRTRLLVNGAGRTRDGPRPPRPPHLPPTPPLDDRRRSSHLWTRHSYFIFTTLQFKSRLWWKIIHQIIIFYFIYRTTRPGGRQRVGAARACAKRPHLSCGCNRLKLKDWVHARRARADFMESLLPRTRAGRGGTARLEGRGEVSLVFIECGRWMSCYESPDRFGSAPRAPCLRRGCVLLSSAAAHSLRTAQF